MPFYLRWHNAIFQHITYLIHSYKFTVYKCMLSNWKRYTSHRNILQIYSVLSLSTDLP